MAGEHILPEELSLNTAINERDADIHTELARLTEGLGDLIDPINEFPSLNKPQAFWGLSCAFADEIIDEDSIDRDHARIATYRACCFADQMINMVMPTTVDYPIGDYVHAVLQTDEPTVTFRNDVETYLSTRPDVDALLKRYLEVVSQSTEPQVHELARMVAAILFNLAEQHMTEEYLSDEFDQISHELPPEQ